MEIISKKRLYDIENKFLASFAQFSTLSKGREYLEPEHEYRTLFQRDRDRIIHCRAFRRLEYKTQVFVNHEGDHYRTRLTHTMEVAQIARNLSRCLSVNEDLTEAIALAHDVGHPPFGHSGERALNELMNEYGGFEHNEQSLRIVRCLEKKYPQFDGLNLTIEVLDALKKHQDDCQLEKAVTIEALIADFCDELAYNCHDLDDGLASGMISLTQMDEIDLWGKLYGEAKMQFGQINEEIAINYTIRNLINYFVTDAIGYSLSQLEEISGLSVEQAREKWKDWISFSYLVKKEAQVIKEFLFKNLYNHPQVESMNQEANIVVKKLFSAFINDESLLPGNTEDKIKKYSVERVVCDYIAGMTDRYALNLYQNLFLPK